jgi:hypothetical protein
LCSVSPRRATVRRSSSCSPRRRCTPTSAVLARVTNLSATCLRCPERWPGSFVVELDGAMVGQVLLRRPAKHCPAAVGKADLGYLFLPRVWGVGYAAEACSAALAWFDRVLPGEPVVLTTQTRQHRVDASRGEAGVHRDRAIPRLGRRAVARSAVPGDAVGLSPRSRGGASRGETPGYRGPRARAATESLQVLAREGQGLADRFEWGSDRSSQAGCGWSFRLV